MAKRSSWTPVLQRFRGCQTAWQFGELTERIRPWLFDPEIACSFPTVAECSLWRTLARELRARAQPAAEKCAPLCQD